jgi:hypothetical protein
MNTRTASHAEMEFSSAERSHLASAFGKAFQKLKQSMPPAATAECESNNHFDEQFHQALAGGLHLKKKFV